MDVTPSQADGREKILTLTPRAEEYLAALAEASRAIEARLRDEIGDDAIERLLQILDAVAGDETRLPTNPVPESPALRGLRLHAATE